MRRKSKARKSKLSLRPPRRTGQVVDIFAALRKGRSGNPPSIKPSEKEKRSFSYPAAARRLVRHEFAERATQDEKLRVAVIKREFERIRTGVFDEFQTSLNELFSSFSRRAFHFGSLKWGADLGFCFIISER